MASPLVYLHGAESNVGKDGPVFFLPVNSSVVGLVGTAPIHLLPEADRKASELLYIYSARRAGQLVGPHRPGFTLPSALRAVYGKTGARCLVVNVFNPAEHKKDVSASEKTFANGVIQLAHQDIVAVTVQDQARSETHVEGTDYDIDRARGRIARAPGGGIATGATVSVAYSYADLTRVTSADIVGGVDTNGVRSGLQKLKDSLIAYGLKAKLVGAPGFASATPVRNALQGLVQTQRGHCFVDAPTGLSVAGAIQSRGPSGDADVFFTSHDRTALCYPHIKEYDPLTDASVLAPLSQHAIGLFAQVQAAEGLQVSASNHEIVGITGVEREIYSDFTDPNSEANLLNEAGINTVYRGFGTGNRLWGNRTAAWPTSTHVSTFISVQSVSDMIAETIEANWLQFIDRPLTIGLIDSVVKSTRAFLARLQNQGVILGGDCWFDPSDNDKTQLSAGHIRFRTDNLAPPPAERLTNEQAYAIGYLAKLAEDAAAAYGRQEG